MILKSKLSIIEVERGLIRNEGIPLGFIITDRNVFERNKESLKNRKEMFVIEPGEKSKSIEIYMQILKKLSEIDFVERIIAFGGGVVGDIAGFVASTYKRGIELIQIPTTLLAMVDSGIGGKNGIDIGLKKNYVGTIYQPKKILIDSSFLDSLPEKEFSNGLAEMIKHSYIMNKPKLERFCKKVNKNDKDINEIILKSAEVKIKITEKDTKDNGLRKALNFGHTIGHAIELLHNLSHGEAISIGMVKEAMLANKIGLVKQDKIDSLIKSFEVNGLPISWPKGASAEKIIEIMKYDKKGAFLFAFDIKNHNKFINEKTVRDFLKEDIDLND
ncbi:3-dehydroquinate synthase [Candidatus Pacearchaeota archaeon]|nr:3-dehydroquinate synthase [Candidatus Pacearchaeota archaeon]